MTTLAKLMRLRVWGRLEAQGAAQLPWALRVQLLAWPPWERERAVSLPCHSL